jgi:hypothetical protein
MGNSTRDRRRILQAAYLRTAYWIHADGRDFKVSVGRNAVALERWLGKNRWNCWAFIGACNPGARLLSGRVNRNRHRALVARLAAQGRKWFAAVAVPAGGSWPSEPSVFVPGMAIVEASRTARRFGQNALIFGRRSQAPRLLWCKQP